MNLHHVRFTTWLHWFVHCNTGLNYIVKYMKGIEGLTIYFFHFSSSFVWRGFCGWEVVTIVWAGLRSRPLAWGLTTRVQCQWHTVKKIGRNVL